MSAPNAFVTAMVCFFLGIGLATWIAYESHQEHAHQTAPYALKQNGDTLFIPTQVVVKHDTLVVIRTEERQPYPDTTSDFYMLPLGGGWRVDPLFANDKQRDTIYEHKIIYY